MARWLADKQLSSCQQCTYGGQWLALMYQRNGGWRYVAGWVDWCDLNLRRRQWRNGVFSAMALAA